MGLNWNFQRGGGFKPKNKQQNAILSKFVTFQDDNFQLVLASCKQKLFNKVPNTKAVK